MTIPTTPPPGHAPGGARFPTDQAARPRIKRLFRRLTLLWAW
jgi:hypothetical protein